jgi:2-polyprenyl-3-methyl-5-hydroxy-6-metoxy-1,4-benzoquinol methylase
MKECPVCANHDVIPLRDRLRDRENSRVLVCNHCETGFLEDIKTQDELDEYYRSDYRCDFKPNLGAETNAKELFDTHEKFQADRIRILSPYFNGKNRLLEIGCSAGMFLYHVKQHFKEVVGVELDKESAHFAGTACDCSVYPSPLHEIPLRSNSFDVICAFQVLEHVSNPADFIQKTMRLLKKDGILFFESPNRFDVLVSGYDLPYHRQFFFHSAHNYYFTEKGLRILLSKCGLRAEFIYTQDYNLFNHVNWINNDWPQNGCIKGLSSPSVEFNSGVSNVIKKNLSEFFLKTDREYKALLCRLKISSNISFIAKREE